MGEQNGNDHDAFMALPIRELELPDPSKFEASVKLEDLDGPPFSPSEKKMLRGISTVEQWCKWCATELVETNRNLRMMQKAMIEHHRSARILRDQQREAQIKATLFKTITWPLLAGLLAAWGKKFIDKVWP